jgi:hypothetical protein
MFLVLKKGTKTSLRNAILGVSAVWAPGLWNIWSGKHKWELTKFVREGRNNPSEQDQGRRGAASCKPNPPGSAPAWRH